MFRLAPSASLRLSDEAIMVAEQFLGALPPSSRRHIQLVKLFGPQARRYDPELPFDFLIVSDDASITVRTGVAIAVAAVESGGLHSARITSATASEYQNASGTLSRIRQNAEREGVDLWVRPPAATELTA
jgi:hypothetical protein